MQSIDFFNKNGYVVLTDVLTKDQCKELTQHMFNLHEQGKLIKDDQCPTSDAVYGDPVFDKILQDFAEPVGKQVGKRLKSSERVVLAIDNNEKMRAAYQSSGIKTIHPSQLSDSMLKLNIVF